LIGSTRCPAGLAGHCQGPTHRGLAVAARHEAPPNTKANALGTRDDRQDRRRGWGWGESVGEFSKTSNYEFVAAQFLIFFWPFDSETKMVWAVGRGAAALAALSAVATLAVIATSHSGRWVSLATAAELREITWAERSDMNPSNLAAKNDDGHTRMWDAAGNLVKREHHSRKKAVSDQGRNFYGMPKFFAHSTGYVQDYVSQVPPVAPRGQELADVSASNSV